MANIQSIEIARVAVGYYQVTSLSSAVACPGPGSVVMIQAEGDALRYRIDGTNPTSSVGFLLAEGDTHVINMGQGNIQNIKVIETTGSGILNVQTFR